MSKPHRPLEGVAVYLDDDAQAFCVFTNFIADPAKRSLKFEREIAADFPPLGLEDPRAQEEYFMNFDAAKGKLIYYAYSPSYSIVSPFVIPGSNFTRQFLSFDFGDQTSILFIAQDPVTQQSVVYDELYPYRETIATMQLMIHERFAERHHLEVGKFRLNDHLEDCIGDPHGASLAREFGEGDLAIRIRCKGVKTWDGSRLEDHERGWRRANELLAPGFKHCSRRQNPRTLDGGYGQLARCHFCNLGPFKAEPLIVFMEGRTPNLVRTFGDQVKETVAEGLAETDKEKKGIEDHLWDTFRYFCQRVTIRESNKAAQEDLLTRPVASLSVPERVQRILAQKLLDQEAEFDEVVRFEDGVHVVESDHANIAVVDFGGDEMGLYEEDV